MTESFGTRVAGGFAWTLLGRGSSLALNIVVGVTLTRLLSPDQIGLATIATVCAGFAEVFAQIGLPPAIVQRDEVEPRHLNTAFWTDIAIGVVWGLGFVAAAPLIAGIYGDPRLLPLLLVLAAMFPASAMGTTHRAQLQRGLEFGKLARIEVVCSLTVGVATIVAVAFGAGVWAIILRAVLTRVVITALSWAAIRWLPSLQYDRQALEELFGFSGRLFASEVIAYLARSTDRLVMGRFFGTETVGYYSRAVGLVVQPLGNLTQVVARVLFPSLARIQTDLSHVRSVYVRVVGVITLISAPMTVGLLVLSDDLVVVVLGEAWLPAGQFVRILAPLLLWQSMLNMNTTVFMSLGRADLMLRLTIVTRLLVFLSTLGGLPWGPVGMAWGYLLGNGAGAVITETFAGRIIHLQWQTLAKPFAQIALCAGLFAVALYGAMHWAWSEGMDRLPRLLLGVGAAAVAYPLALALVRPGPLRDAIHFARQWRERRRREIDDD